MDFYDTENMTADYYPVLASRRPFGFPASRPGRYNGAIGGDYIYVAIGTKLYRYNKDSENPQHYDEITGVTLTDTPKRMTMLGKRLIIFPDKICVTVPEDGTPPVVESLEAEETFDSGDNSVTASGVIFWIGGFNAPVIQIPESTDIFSDGDTVLISGCTTHAENNKAIDTATVEVVHTGDPAVYGTNFYFSYNALTIGSDSVTIVTDSGYATKTGHVESGPVTLTNYSKASVKFFSGSYEGEAAAANCIQLPGHITSFAVGDAVKIAGCSNPKNNFEALVIREISYQTYSGAYFTTLHFYENSFDIGDGKVYVVDDNSAMREVDGYAESGTITFSRNVPDLDILFSHENRVWGAKNDTIWASALGKPEVWYNFDLTGLESWTVDVLDEGDFTGGCSFLGYPIFFKDNHIYKIYGSIPSEFRVVGSADLGVAPGSDKSLAIAGEKLYYMSRVGIMVYSGALPQIISAPLADIEYKNAIAGSDGVKYWVSLERIDGEREIFVYDTQSGLWHKEVYLQKRRLFIGFVYHNHGIYAVYEAPPDDDHVNYYTDLCYIGQDMYAPPDVPGFDPEVTEWYVETHDITEASPLRKWIGAELDIRAELGTGDDDTADFSVYISYDFKRTWQKIGGPYSGHGKRSYIVPQIPRRADYFSLRIEGHGRVWIYSIAPKTEQGSSWHGINGGD
jgi:hypothetical protein